MSLRVRRQVVSHNHCVVVLTALSMLRGACVASNSKVFVLFSCLRILQLLNPLWRWASILLGCAWCSLAAARV
jgi:hypothetical protein